MGQFTSLRSYSVRGYHSRVIIQNTVSYENRCPFTISLNSHSLSFSPLTLSYDRSLGAT